jgi:SAM-dependent methyltransferase
LSKPILHISDQEFLKSQQYKTPSNLNARIELHRRFGTNPYSWFHWVLDQMVPAPGNSLLEIGCGPGDLWLENRDRLPQSLLVTLGDLSKGMVAKARQRLLGLANIIHLDYLGLDAQALPFSNERFDLIIANHMLYHVPDISKAAAEIRRLLKPRGRLIAATNGFGHMRELHDLIKGFNPAFHADEHARRFALENAASLLNPYFDRFEVRLFHDDLEVTDVEPLLAYIFSMWDVFPVPDEAMRSELDGYVRSQFQKSGSFHISKSQGVVVAFG